MSNPALNRMISFDNKSLQILAVSLHGERIPDYLTEIIEDAFGQIAPFLKDNLQVIYLRDIRFLAIEDKYPGAHCYNRHEIMVSVPSWRTEKKPLAAAINHELHHMARWQNGGYGKTLGGAILSEGIATYYEKLRTGWAPPWSEVSINDELIQKAIKEWDNEKYNHSEWFFGGKLGKWAGYSIGFKLAERIFEDGFDLKQSIEIDNKKAKSYLKEK